MEKVSTAIIGGGASGLFLATLITAYNQTATQPISFVLLEKNDRLGKKLSATGNGQGNVTNLAAEQEGYFSSTAEGRSRAQTLVRKYPHTQFFEFWEKLGVLLIADERGRVYPASRQASALTDGLRHYLTQHCADVRLQTCVTGLKKEKQGIAHVCNTSNGVFTLAADNVVLCTGGKAAKNFGTDGASYALAQGLGHGCTALYPALVQIKPDVSHIKTLKGIRVNDGVVTASADGQILSLQGDIIFTDYGVSGDAIFRLSAFLADKLGKADVQLTLDFLPAFTEEETYRVLQAKRKAFPALPVSELLFGIVNNQVGRAVFKRANNDLKTAAKLVKAFPLTATGSLGFDYAQVTKGGIPLSETDDTLQSRIANGVYFAGETLDVDGACGGFNLQWAYSSACAVFDGILAKTRGQV